MDLYQPSHSPCIGEGKSVFIRWLMWWPGHTVVHGKVGLHRDGSGSGHLLGVHEDLPLCAYWRPLCLSCNYTDPGCAMPDTHWGIRGGPHGHDCGQCLAVALGECVGVWPNLPSISEPFLLNVVLFTLFPMCPIVSGDCVSVHACLFRVSVGGITGTVVRCIMRFHQFAAVLVFSVKRPALVLYAPIPFN